MDASKIIEFLGKLFDVIKIIVTLVGVWLMFGGGVAIAEGNAESNPDAKDRGYKKMASGIGVILLAWLGIPYVKEYVDSLIQGAGGTTSAIIPRFFG